MGLSQEVSNFLINVLGSSNARVQIDVFRHRAPDIEFSSNYNATGMESLTCMIWHIKKHAVFSTYHATP
jgi:hypothetical protein